MKKYTDKIFTAITAVGALCVGACIITSELIFPKIEELTTTPQWYIIVFCVSFLIAGIGAIGGVLAKNKTNTSKKEAIIEAIPLTAGIACMATTFIRTEAYWKDVVVCIGGALFALGFFCGIPTIAGLCQKTVKRPDLSPQKLLWNKMMDLYADGKLSSPLYELIDYENGIYGEGHYCTFDNYGDKLDAVSEQLKKILPDDFRKNYEKALFAYKTGEDVEKVCGEADTYFYENVSKIDDVLKFYCNRLENFVEGYKDYRGELDSLALRYNSLLSGPASDSVNKNAEFWGIYDFVLDLEKKGFLVIIRGDCPLAHLREIMENDGPEYCATVRFSLLSRIKESYKIGVCVRGTPLFKKEINDPDYR